MTGRQHEPTRRRLHTSRQNATHLVRSLLCVFLSFLLVTSSISTTTIVQVAAAQSDDAAGQLASMAEALDVEETTFSSPADGPSSGEPANELKEASSSDAGSDAGDSRDETSDEASSTEGESGNSADVSPVPDAGSGLVPAESSSGSLMAMAQASVDLNSLWNSQKGGTSASLMIKEGGTYTLTANLKVSGCVTIDAPGKDVTIDLGTYQILAKQPANGSLINVTACASLTIRGSRPLAGIAAGGGATVQDQIVIDEGDLRHGIEFSGEKLVLENVGIALRGHKNYAETKDLDACGVYVTKGEARISNCSILVDHSVQAKTYTGQDSFSGFPKVLYLGKDAGACLLEHSTLKMQGSPVVCRPKTVSYSPTTFDNVYGVYSETDKMVTVQGGSISTNCALGAATSIYARSINITKSTLDDSVFSAYDVDSPAREQAEKIRTLTISANGGSQAYGVFVRDKGQVVLDAPIRFDLDDSSSSSPRAALRTSNEGGIVFGNDFATEGASVITGASLTDANRAGMCFGRFADGTSEQNRQRIIDGLKNGLENAVCAIRAEGNKLVFAFEEERAPAVIVDRGGNERACETVEQALREQKEGETVKLLRDCPSLSIDAKRFPPPDGRSEILLDLNGNTIFGLVVDTEESVRIFSSFSQRGIIRSLAGQEEPCILHKGGGSLFLDGIDVLGVSQNRSAGKTAYGIEKTGSGSLTLSDVDLRVVSETSSAGGIYQGRAGSVLRIENSTIAVSSDTPGIGVTGVRQSAAASLSLVDCVIDVRSYDGMTGAVEAAGEVDVRGGSLCATTRKAASRVSSIRLTSNASRASLTGTSCSSLCVEDTVDSGYCCLMAGSVQPMNNATWTLGGTCSFESSADSHINHKKTPIVLKPGFASSKTIVINSADLDDDKVITFSDTPGQDVLSNTCALFEAQKRSDYEGWGLAGGDGDVLRWSRGPVVRNASSGNAYVSLSEALGEASMGDVLELLGDTRETRCLDMPAGITFDLAGHTLALEVPISTIRSDTGGICNLKGAGAHSIKNGTIAVSIETSLSFLNNHIFLAAMKLEKNADLDLEDVCVRLDVSGESVSTLGTTRIAGIHVSGSVLQLLGTSDIELNIDTSQPIQAQGVVVGEGEDVASLFLGPDASVTVNNDSLRQARGTIWYPDARLMNNQTLNLVRFYPDKNSEAYEAFQERFKEKAKADVIADENGHAYDSSLYYATPIAWDDDANIWAFSRPVSSEKVGLLDSVQADVFYSQSHYDDIPQAQAIVIAGSSPAAHIEGKVSATSTYGDASAISIDSSQSAGGKETDGIEVASSDLLTASASGEAYWKQLGEIDFNSALGVKSERKLVYPCDREDKSGSTFTLREVQQVLPAARLIAGDDVSSVRFFDTGAGLETSASERSSSVEETSDESSNLTEPIRSVPETVEVSFGNLRDSNGRPLDAIVRTQDYGSTIGAGGAIPAPNDYTHNGISYRFVGWRVSRGFQDSGTWSPGSIADLKLDRSSGASQDTLLVNAVYVPVLEGQHLVTFVNGTHVMAYAVDEGQRPDYQAAAPGATVSVPSFDSWSSGTLYGFTGWKNADESTGDAALLNGPLPKAHSDCTYIAAFSKTPRKGHTDFYTWQIVNGKLVYTYNRAEVFYGENGAAKASALAKPGNPLYSDDTVYEFVGWAPRQSDKEAYYEFVPPALADVNTVKSVYGVYNTRARIIPVNFYVDGKLYARSPAMLGTTTLNAAFAASGKDKPENKGEDQRFRGWSLKPNDTNYIRGTVRSLSSLTTGESSIDVYAVYGSAVPEEDPAKEPGQGNTGHTGGAGSGSATNGSSNSAPIYSTTFSPVGGLGGSDLTAAVKGDVSLDGVLAQDAGSLSTLEDEEATEASPAMALATFVLLILLLGAIAAWWIICARRNRKLDREDDFFEPGTGDSHVEQVVF